MPRKDPMTGVEVMTSTEFWQKEAKMNGTDPIDEVVNFWKDFDREVRSDEANRLLQLQNDPSQLLDDISLYCRDEEIKAPDSITVTDVKLNCTLNNSKEIITGLARFGDSELAFQVIIENYSGTYWEPPEYEFIFEYEGMG